MRACKEVGNGLTLLIKMAEVTLIDFSYLNRLALSTFTEGDPSFKSRFKAGASHRKSFLPYNIQDQLVMTLVDIISKGQPCPTSSGVLHAFARGSGAGSRHVEQKGSVLCVVQPTLHLTLGVYDICPLIARYMW